MDVELSLGRIRTQLTGMERMTRILRAEIESQITGFAAGSVETESEIASGLGALFAEAAPLAPMAADPYAHFAPGVWIGLDQETPGTGATIAMRALRRPGVADPARGVSRLCVNPVFPAVQKPRWVTLETAVPVEGLRAASALRIDLIGFFQIGPGNSAEIPRSVTLNLRLHRGGGKATDHVNYRIPVSTMPFEHSVRIGAAAMAELDLRDVTEAILIFELPLSGTYTFALDHFAVLALDQG